MYPGMLLHTLYGLIHFISTIIVCGIYYNIPCVVQKRGSENSINVCKLHSWWVMRQSGPSLKCTPSTLPHTHGRQDWQAPSQCWGLTNSTETRDKQISQDKGTWRHLAQITFIRCFTPVCAPSHWSQMGQAGKTFRVQEQVCVCDIIQVKPLHELEWAKLLQTIKSWVLFIVPSTVIVANLVLDTHACIDPANIYKHSTFLNTRETGTAWASTFRLILNFAESIPSKTLKNPRIPSPLSNWLTYNRTAGPTGLTSQRPTFVCPVPSPHQERSWCWCYCVNTMSSSSWGGCGTIGDWPSWGKTFEG